MLDCPFFYLVLLLVYLSLRINGQFCIVLALIYLALMSEQVKIEDSWRQLLSAEFKKEYFVKIKESILASRKAGKRVFPPGHLIFNAFDTTPVQSIKVVILGQDPYHRPGQAMGLSFSVPRGVRVPPSLANVYKELQSDVSFTPPTHGDLTQWAAQGVFLLNACLTVEEGAAASHGNIGWQSFTDAVIQQVSAECDAVVFMLWGNYAKTKAKLINASKHLVLQAAHPSPLARNRFSGCAHFSKANAYLKANGKEPIDWQLT